MKKLGNEEAESCEGLLTIKECSEALNKFQNNKTPGSDGFTIEFYRCFWNAVAPFMVDSFNYGFENGLLTISQRLAIISLIPKKDQNLQYQKKIGGQSPFLMLNIKSPQKPCTWNRKSSELPKVINESQTGYVDQR